MSFGGLTELLRTLQYVFQRVNGAFTDSTVCLAELTETPTDSTVCLAEN
jgi:hypothetical protein